MSDYIRAKSEGASYFFTLVSYRRQNILCDQAIRKALHSAVVEAQGRYPFGIDAWILMPDHLHCIWTLPDKDANYSRRWSFIKRKVSLKCQEYKNESWINRSKTKHRESTIWQRRFWEHKIRDQKDFENHMDYIHYNPVKHGLCESPLLWPYSTLHKLVKSGHYPIDWGANKAIAFYGDFGE